MTVIVDTGVLYAETDSDASRRDAATEALDTVYDGAFGHPYVSDYVYDEAGASSATKPVHHLRRSRCIICDEAGASYRLFSKWSVLVVPVSTHVVVWAADRRS